MALLEAQLQPDPPQGQPNSDLGYVRALPRYALLDSMRARYRLLCQASTVPQHAPQHAAYQPPQGSASSLDQPRPPRQPREDQASALKRPISLAQHSRAAPLCLPGLSASAKTAFAAARARLAASQPTSLSSIPEDEAILQPPQQSARPAAEPRHALIAPQILASLQADAQAVAGPDGQAQSPPRWQRLRGMTLLGRKARQSELRQAQAAQQAAQQDASQVRLQPAEHAPVPAHEDAAQPDLAQQAGAWFEQQGNHPQHRQSTGRDMQTGQAEVQWLQPDPPTAWRSRAEAQHSFHAHYEDAAWANGRPLLPGPQQHAQPVNTYSSQAPVGNPAACRIPMRLEPSERLTDAQAEPRGEAEPRAPRRLIFRHFGAAQSDASREQPFPSAPAATTSTQHAHGAQQPQSLDTGPRSAYPPWFPNKRPKLSKAHALPPRRDPAVQPQATSRDADASCSLPARSCQGQAECPAALSTMPSCPHATTALEAGGTCNHPRPGKAQAPAPMQRKRAAGLETSCKPPRKRQRPAKSSSKASRERSRPDVTQLDSQVSDPEDLQPLASLQLHAASRMPNGVYDDDAVPCSLSTRAGQLPGNSSGITAAQHQPACSAPQGIQSEDPAHASAALHAANSLPEPDDHMPVAPSAPPTANGVAVTWPERPCPSGSSRAEPWQGSLPTKPPPPLPKAAYLQQPPGPGPASRGVLAVQANPTRPGHMSGANVHASWKLSKQRMHRFVVRRSGVAGQGVFTTGYVNANELVMEYVGEVVRRPLSDIRERKYKAAAQGLYFFALDEDHVIDSTLRGNLARYINHSCNPNCVAKLADVEGRRRVCILAKHELAPGEELTYDYCLSSEQPNKSTWGDEHNAGSHRECAIPCRCGAANCRGHL